MITYDPESHTLDALADQIESITDLHPEALLVGSLGRSAIYRSLLGDPTYEYKYRGKLPTQSYQGSPIDIDLVNAASLVEVELRPFPVDLKSFNGRQIAIVRSDERWYLQSSNRGYRAELDPRVMEPIHAKTIHGTRCYTLSEQTHQALLGITGTLREQDIMAKSLLAEVMESRQVGRLPVRLYEPFFELRELNYKSLLERTRRHYRSTVPFMVRRRLAPAMQRIKDHQLR